MTQADAYSSNSHGSHGAGHGHGHGDEPHVLPLSVYFGVWAALVVLTVITVAVSRFDFGSANTVIAMFVATIKGSLVALFFMHLWEQRKVYRFVLLGSTVFVLLLMTFVLTDVHTRFPPARPQKPVVGAVQELSPHQLIERMDRMQSEGRDQKR